MAMTSTEVVRYPSLIPPLGTGSRLAADGFASGIRYSAVQSAPSPRSDVQSGEYNMPHSPSPPGISTRWLGSSMSTIAEPLSIPKITWRSSGESVGLTESS